MENSTHFLISDLREIYQNHCKYTLIYLCIKKIIVHFFDYILICISWSNCHLSSCRKSDNSAFVLPLEDLELKYCKWDIYIILRGISILLVDRDD